MMSRSFMALARTARTGASSWGSVITTQASAFQTWTWAGSWSFGYTRIANPPVKQIVGVNIAKRLGFSEPRSSRPTGTAVLQPRRSKGRFHGLAAATYAVMGEFLVAWYLHSVIGLPK
jgi:ribosomal protein L34